MGDAESGQHAHRMPTIYILTCEAVRTLFLIWIAV